MTEPITTLTDYAISLLAFIFAGVLLCQSWKQRQISIRFWAIAFGCVALAAGLGGTCHGFVATLGQPLTQRFWVSMLYLLTLASLTLLWGTVLSTLSPPWQTWGLLAALVKAGLIWSLLQTLPLAFPKFTLVAWDYASALGMALLLYGGLCWTQTHPARARSAPWMIAGILTSGLAISVLATQLTLGPFSSADLYHLIQLGGLGLLFQGAKHLRDR
ncbi:MAG: DUF6962 family protein [Elainella sp.]